MRTLIRRLLVLLIFSLPLAADLAHSGSSSDAFAELDRAARSGRKKLRDWVETEDRSAERAFSRIEYRRSAQPGILSELWFEGRLAYRLKQKLGEGVHATVYLTDKGTALKVPHDADSARSNLVQVWAADMVRKRGFDIPRVIAFERHGVFIEQEYIPGQNLRDKYASSRSLPPADVVAKVHAGWNRARQFAAETGHFLDFKAANFHERPNGDLVLVDYPPRLNSSYFKYYWREKGKELKLEEFFGLFFYNDRKHPNGKLIANHICSARVL